jgi:biopolymer transport protein ExbD
MTPMIDVTFLLLVFFMLTIHFRTLEGVMKAQLPKGVGPGTGAEEPEEKLRVRVDLVDPATRAVCWSVGPWRTADADALARRLGELRRAQTAASVVIDAREGTNCAEAVQTLDAARLAGWERISFAAARP